MAFDKQFFAGIHQRIEHYLAVYPTLNPTVSIRTAWNEQFNVKEILETHEGYVLFTYYSKDKSVPLHDAVKPGESTGYPALALAYEAILSVEFNPAGVTETKLGFKMR